MLGWRTVCAVEWESYPASVLCARQNDRILAPFPIWDDVCTFDGRPWRGIIDVVSGGFPCQDISAAGGGGRHYRIPQRPLERNGTHCWRSTTSIRVCGKQPNAHFSRTWNSSWRLGRAGVRCGMGRAISSRCWRAAPQRKNLGSGLLQQRWTSCRRSQPNHCTEKQRSTDRGAASQRICAIK